jgi:hypothetical protein
LKQINTPEVKHEKENKTQQIESSLMDESTIQQRQRQGYRSIMATKGKDKIKETTPISKKKVTEVVE